MSGSMTGGHVGAYPLLMFTDEGSPKLLFGAMTTEKSSFAYFSIKKSRSSDRTKLILISHWISVYTGMTGEEKISSID